MVRELRAVWFVFRQWWVLVPTVALTALVGAGLIGYAVFMGRSVAEFGALLVIVPLIGFGLGTLFGVCGFLLLRSIRSGPEPFAPDGGEAVLREESAVHWLGAERRVGRLTVTDRRAVFVPGRFSIQRENADLSADVK